MLLPPAVDIQQVPSLAGAILRNKENSRCSQGCFSSFSPGRGNIQQGPISAFKVHSDILPLVRVFHHFWFPIPRPGLIWPGSVSEGHHLDHRLVL